MHHMLNINEDYQYHHHMHNRCAHAHTTPYHHGVVPFAALEFVFYGTSAASNTNFNMGNGADYEGIHSAGTACACRYRPGQEARQSHLSPPVQSGKNYTLVSFTRYIILVEYVIPC